MAVYISKTYLIFDSIFTIGSTLDINFSRPTPANAAKLDASNRCFFFARREEETARIPRSRRATSAANISTTAADLSVIPRGIASGRPSVTDGVKKKYAKKI